MRVAINGMGRIGRLLFKLLVQKNGIEIVAVNDLMTPDNLLYLLKYDSISGAYNKEISLRGEMLLTSAGATKVLSFSDPEQLPWKDLNVDLVVECTGRFTSAPLLKKHCMAGAKKVLLSTTGSEHIPLLIKGFNDSLLKEDHAIISSGGCMTNCSTMILSPLMKYCSAESIHINVLHAYTSRQSLVDGANKNFRRGRASSTSIIPVEIDLAETLERLFPKTKGRITTTSTRVPVLCGALADFSIVTKEDISADELNKLYKHASTHELKNILGYTDDLIVSADIIGNAHSAIFDSTQTKAIGNHLKIGAWFDNEFGYTNRLSEIVEALK